MIDYISYNNSGGENMNYNEILKSIALKNSTTPEVVEREMSIALKMAGISCSPKEFIEKTSTLIKKDYKSYLV